MDGPKLRLTIMEVFDSSDSQLESNSVGRIK